MQQAEMGYYKPGTWTWSSSNIYHYITCLFLQIITYFSIEEQISRLKLEEGIFFYLQVGLVTSLRCPYIPYQHVWFTGWILR